MKPRYVMYICFNLIFSMIPIANCLVNFYTSLNPLEF